MRQDADPHQPPDPDQPADLPASADSSPNPTATPPSGSQPDPALRPLDLVTYLLGHRAAIERLAAHPAAWLTGALLALLTSVPRSYDQTFLADQPIRWVLGPLLFSLVSGTWLYLITYAGFAKEDDLGPRRLSSAAEWRSFMGLFWCTAPIAWIYALPVERWLGSIEAAKANLGLLGLVSLWRVLLIARALQVATRSRFLPTLAWVLVAAGIETIVILLLGGHFARAIMRGMGGLRNSPEEDLLFGAMSKIFSFAFWGTPVALLAALALNSRRLLNRLPGTAFQRSPHGVPWPLLAGCALMWAAIAIIPQQELARSRQVEALVETDQFRPALDRLAAHAPGDFAPARRLPPVPFENRFLMELAGLLDAVQPSDPAWVQSHLTGRMNALVLMAADPWGRRHRRPAPSPPPEKEVEEMAQALDWVDRNPDPGKWLGLLAGLERIEPGRRWLATNDLFLQAVRRWALKESREAAPSSPPPTGTHSGLAPPNTPGAQGTIHGWPRLIEQLERRTGPTPPNQSAPPPRTPTTPAP